MGDSLANGRDGIIDHDVAGRPDNFETGYSPVFFDSDAHRCRNFAGRCDAGRRLTPFTVKPVVKHLAERSQFGVWPFALSVTGATSSGMAAAAVRG